MHLLKLKCSKADEGGRIWQDPGNLRRLLSCMEANGLVPDPTAVRIVACPPYEYLQTAEHNGRPVGFISKGTLVRAPTPCRTSV